jgi:hypothetical protein
MDALVAVADAFGELMWTVLPWFAAGTLTAALVETSSRLPGQAGCSAAVRVYRRR